MLRQATLPPCDTRNARPLPLGPAPWGFVGLGTESQALSVRLAPLPPSFGLFQTRFGQQGIEQVVIQIQSVRDLVGFDENRPGFRGLLVRQVLQVLGDRTMIQVDVVQGAFFRAARQEKS
jgi:hypothetical protein